MIRSPSTVVPPLGKKQFQIPKQVRNESGVKTPIGINGMAGVGAMMPQAPAQKVKKLPTVMDAIFYREKGFVHDVLQFAKISVPSLKPMHLLVQVHAVGLNDLDITTITNEGCLKGGREELDNDVRMVPGVDVSGTVVGVGDQVSGWSVGDDVICLNSDGGGCATFISVACNNAVAKPKSMAHAEAASVPFSGVTAMQALEKASLEKGERIVVTGAATGTGCLIVQLARSVYNAHITVIVNRGETNAFEVAKKLEPDVLLDKSSGDNRMTGSVQFGSFDAAFDTVGDAHKLVPFVRKGGIVVSSKCVPTLETYNELGVNLSKKECAEVKEESARITKVCKSRGVMYRYIVPKVDSDALYKLRNLVEQHAMRSPYGPVYGLSKFNDAFSAQCDGVKTGKIIILLK